jgi:hypothetical protein
MRVQKGRKFYFSSSKGLSYLVSPKAAVELVKKERERGKMKNS